MIRKSIENVLEDLRKSDIMKKTKEELWMKNNKSYITKTHRILEILSWCLLAASFAVSIYGIIVLPDEIAIHFGLDGTADGFGSPKTLLLTPAIVFFILLLISFSAHKVKPENWNIPFELTESNKHKVYRVMLDMLFAIELEIAAFFLYVSVEEFLQSGSRILIVMGVWIVILFLTIIVLCTKAKRVNYKFDV